MASESEIHQRFSQLGVWLDERSRRLWAAAESVAHGRGGISLVSRASGVSRRAIAVGLTELQKKPDRSPGRGLPIRQKGAGRKKTSLKDPALLADLEKLLEPGKGFAHRFSIECGLRRLDAVVVPQDPHTPEDFIRVGN